MGSVHAVIVNWNAGRQLADCLDSFAAVRGDDVSLAEITVVDNASDDQSADALSRYAASLPMRVVRNVENRGFAAACNQGAAGSTADFLLFLNPDTRLGLGCLERPVKFLEDPHNCSVGIIGVQLIDEHGQVVRSCSRVPSLRAMIGQTLGVDRIFPARCPPLLMLDWPHDVTRTVDQVMGAFYFVRRSLFESLGGFDERFFVYFEDLDFAMRARARGATSSYLATARAFHRGGGTTRDIPARRLFYFCRSRVLFGLKHFSPAGATMLAVTTICLEPVARILSTLVTAHATNTFDVLRGFIMLWRDLPNIVRTHARLKNA
jgi:N-acetylglucosaminyl-diphospho-decaprenol L-rhamnosyltransferase